jgi:Ca2+-binding EF-hand superfamily protein
MMTGKMGDRDSPEEIRRVFKLFDDDETGRISFRNLKRVARELCAAHIRPATGICSARWHRLTS